MLRELQEDSKAMANNTATSGTRVSVQKLIGLLVLG
jgi:hypothetical protein